MVHVGTFVVHTHRETGARTLLDEGAGLTVLEMIISACLGSYGHTEERGKHA